MIPLPPRVNDLRGREFGRLTVCEFAGVRGGGAYWTCDCACGKSGIEVRGTKMVQGRTVSCGCAKADPLVRSAARLTMTPEDRRRAARGEKVTPEKPPTKPRPVRAKRSPLNRGGAPEQTGPMKPETAEAFNGADARSNRTAWTPRAQGAPTEQPAAGAPHSLWVTITKERGPGYRVSVRLHRVAATAVLQSRRMALSEARRETRRIFGDRLNWMTGKDAGLPAWVVEIAEVRL